ncbi:MAG: hypothetical protein C3F17_00250 [Bradyrhizobiaceae bacterium]|nr:MAG: hypothetical protein C3F17_00250 [Bradyrhizobiaceae bacterium]
MTDRVKLLNERGTKVFRQYLAKRGTLVREPPPFAILDDPACCEDLGAPIEIERTPGGRKFANRYAFGQYLQQKLSDLDRTRIFRTFGLWNWLSLYYFDQLCPPALDGSRELLATETYLLSPQQQYRLSFRHLVRAPWYAVCEHGENARVLLIHADRGISPLATRGAVFEQLASRQNILNNPTLIAAAQRLYFDESANRAHWGTSGHGPGSVRRFALVVQQLELTYDTRACSVDQLISLLPNEFNEWKAKAAAARQLDLV